MSQKYIFYDEFYGKTFIFYNTWDKMFKELYLLDLIHTLNTWASLILELVAPVGNASLIGHFYS